MTFPTHHELENFTGTAPLFPLPNVVLFPHNLLPLHIFEPRYRQMVADALNTDRLIAMAFLTNPQQATPNPKIDEIVTVGKIVSETCLPDGRYQLLLQGITRARIIQEHDSDLPYRTAELDLLPTPACTLTEKEAHSYREQLLTLFHDLHPQIDLRIIFQDAIENEFPLAQLCDILAHTLNLPPAQAQKLLREPNLTNRCQQLLKIIQHELSQQSHPPRFPPRFSLN